MKGYSAFPKARVLSEPHHQIVSCHIQDTQYVLGYLTTLHITKGDHCLTRMLQAILNWSWRQHPTKWQLYGHLPPSRKLSKLDEPDMKDTAGEVGTSSQVMHSYGPLHIADPKQGAQLEPKHSSSVRIQGVALRTC